MRYGKGIEMFNASMVRFGGVVLVAASLVSCGSSGDEPAEGEFNAITIGMPGEDVLALVGVPDVVALEADNVTTDYQEWDEGYRVYFEDEKVVAVLQGGELIKGELPD